MSDKLSKQELFVRSLKRKRTAIKIAQWGILVFFLIFWEVGTRLGWLDAFITSSPTRIFNTIAGMTADGSLWEHVLITVAETVAGFLLGTVLGVAIAVALWWSDTARRIADPYLVVLNSLPKVALGPVIIVWMGAGAKAIIAMALLISLIVTIMTVLNGFIEVGYETTQLMMTFRASKMQILTKAILPASVPTFVSALKINVGMSWIGVIMGEFLVSRAGLGYLIVYGGQVFKLDLVMAGVVLLCICAAVMYLAVAALEKKLLK
ncbi:MAG: ABC transporter permease [Christensenellales bacterium]|jgi:NitT/TauT family transport system permease protein